MKRPIRLREHAEIPTSSMADIAFLLIIFFMVTSVFAATRGLRLDLPVEETETDAVTPTPAITIEVGQQGLVVDCRPMNVDALPAYLEPKLARNPDKPVVLYTQPEAEYRRMVEVYDRLTELQVRELLLLSESDRRGYRELFGIDPWSAACR